MNKVLITGVTGQDGIFLVSKLFNINKSTQIIGLSRNNKKNTFYKNILKVNSDINLKNINLLKINYKRKSEIYNILSSFRPNEIYNLMGPSNVNESLNQEVFYHDNLVKPFDSIVDSAQKLKLNLKFFQPSTSEMFDKSNTNLDENSKMKPRNPYSSSKFVIHNKIINLKNNEFLSFNEGIMFNHDSEFRSNKFLIIKIIETALNIKNKNTSVLKIGSLNYVRDWSFAGDIMDGAIKMNITNNQEMYVLGSGKGYSIENIIEIVFDYLNLDWKKYVEIEPKLLRPNDPVKIVSNPIKIKNELDWQTSTHLEDLIKKIIDIKFS